MNAVHEAKTDNSMMGLKDKRVCGALINVLRSKIRKTGRKNIAPKTF
jgi:hypothetical protein